jgi:hypothetical protein
MRTATLTTLAAICFCIATHAQPPAEKPADKPAEKAPPSQEQLERRFAEQLSGSVLAGHFTDNANKEKPLTEERYTISKVSKLKGDIWLFQTRIQYGKHDLSLPLPLAVKWAGDTPVITLTDVEVPGLGKFTARVLIYGDQYAGTWSGGDHGGHLFGRVEKANAQKPPAQSSPSPSGRGPG